MRHRAQPSSGKPKAGADASTGKPLQEMSGASRRCHQAIADSVNHQLSGLVNAESIHDIRAMHRDRICAQIELICDFLVRFSG